MNYKGKDIKILCYEEEAHVGYRKNLINIYLAFSFIIKNLIINTNQMPAHLVTDNLFAFEPKLCPLGFHNTRHEKISYVT